MLSFRQLLFTWTIYDVTVCYVVTHVDRYAAVRVCFRETHV